MLKSSKQPAYRLLNDPLFFITLLVLAILATIFPLALGQKLLMPLVQTLILTAFVAVALRQQRLDRALQILILWFVVELSLVALFTWFFPNRSENALRNGFDYHTSFLEWFYANGAAPSSLVNSFGGRLLEMVAVVIGTTVSGGLAGIWAMVNMVNQAGFSIGWLIHPETPLFKAILAGAPIWTIVRLAGYCGVVLLCAPPLLTGDWSWRALFAQQRRLWMITLVLLALALGLEKTTPGLWRMMLQG
jgi:hypothetical protein